MTPDELLARATEFDAGPCVLYAGFAVVEEDDLIANAIDIYKIVLKHKEKYEWAICRLGTTLNKKGKWEYEPISSQRTKKYLERNRYPSPEAAFEHLEAWKEKERKRLIKSKHITYKEYVEVQKAKGKK